MSASHPSPKTAEQEARDMLERIGVENAQNFSSGNLVELANLIAQSRIGGRYNSILRRHWPEIFAARSPAPEPDFVDELLIADRLRAAPSVEARDADGDGVAARLRTTTGWLDANCQECGTGNSIAISSPLPWLCGACGRSLITGRRSNEARDVDLESAVAVLRHFDYGALADRLAAHGPDNVLRDRLEEVLAKFAAWSGDPLHEAIGDVLALASLLPPEKT